MPAFLAAVPGILSGLGTAATVAGTGAALYGIKQTSDQMKQNEDLARKQAAQDRMNNERIAGALEKVGEAAKNNPDLAKQAGAAVAQNKLQTNAIPPQQQANGSVPQQQAYSEKYKKKTRFVQKNYGLGTALTKFGNSGLANKLTIGSTVAGVGASLYGLKQSNDMAKQQERLSAQEQANQTANNDRLVQAMNNLNTPAPTQTAFSTTATPSPIPGKSGGGAVGGVMSMFGGVSDVMGAKAQHDALKDSAAQAAQLSATKQAQSNDLVNKLNNLATTANMAQKQKNCSYTEDGRRVLFSNHLNDFNMKQKEFSRFGNFGKNAKALGGAVWDFTKNHKGVIYSGIAAGVGMGVIDYAGNKTIQARMKRDGIDMAAINAYQKQKMAQQQQQQGRAIGYPQQPQQQYPQYQRQYAEAPFNPDNPVFTGKTRLERLGKAGKHYGKEAFSGWSVALGGIGVGAKHLGYNQQKEQLLALQNEMRQAQAQPVRRARPRPQMMQQPQQVYGYPQQRQYNAVGDWFRGVGKNIKSGWKSFKSHPGQSILNQASKLSQGGGLEGVNKFGDHLVNYGKANKNQFVQNTGNWIKNHKKTALVGSIAVGTGVMAKAWDVGQKATEKTMRKVDPNAYAYDDFQNQQVQ